MSSTTPEPSRQPLCRGARVRMSPLGRRRHPSYGERQGVIVGQGSPSSWRVKFDDRKVVQAIHQDYLERVPDKDQAAHAGHASAGWPDAASTNA